MKITDFNFLPASYDRIAFTETGSVDIPSSGATVSVDIPTGGLFLPILAISLDGERWYSQFYPPKDSNDTALVSASWVIGSSVDISIGLSRSTPGKAHYKIMGIEL